MMMRTETVDIVVHGQVICGTLYIPPDPIGKILFAHGWGGNQEQYVRRATIVAELGYLGLTFDLRGHARRNEERETVSRADNLRDVLAAYDVLARCPGVAGRLVGVVGSSYGAYLAAILTSLRPVNLLALRAPALYQDNDWELAKVQLHKDPEFASYRKRPLDTASNRALRACANFSGDALIVESEKDQTIPHQVIENYRSAFKSAHSVTWRVVRGADHGLSDPAWQSESTSYLVEWLKNCRNQS